MLFIHPIIFAEFHSIIFAAQLATIDWETICRLGYNNLSITRRLGCSYNCYQKLHILRRKIKIGAYHGHIEIQSNPVHIDKFLEIYIHHRFDNRLGIQLNNVMKECLITREFVTFCSLFIIYPMILFVYYLHGKITECYSIGWKGKLCLLIALHHRSKAWELFGNI